MLSAAHQRLGNLAHADQIPDADNRSDLLAIADETHESTQHSSTAATVPTDCGLPLTRSGFSWSMGIVVQWILADRDAGE